MIAFAKHIRDLPTYLEYTNIHGITYCLSHAGFRYNALKGQRDYLWDRDHFLTEDKIPTNVKIIHGHTPLYSQYGDTTISLSSNYMVYNNSQKINIDCGTYRTGTIVLYDLNKEVDINIIDNRNNVD